MGSDHGVGRDFSGVVAVVGDWETSWGGTAIRTLRILHEVIFDLDMKVYG